MIAHKNLSKVLAVVVALAVLMAFTMSGESFAASKSKDNYAKSIKVSGGKLDKKFNKKTTSYKINLTAAQTKSTITFKKAHKKATVSVKIGAKKWTKYSKKASIKNAVKVANGKTVAVKYKVKAQNGKLKTYTIKVTRAKAAPAPKPPTPAAKQAQAALAIKDGSTTITTLAKQYGDANFTLTASGGSGTGAYAWTSSKPAVATINSGGTVTIVGVGTTTITLSKAGDSNYNAATAKTLALTVAKATLGAISVVVSWTYGDKNPDIDVQGVSGNIPVQFTYYSDSQGQNSIEKPTDVGSYYIKATINATDNYTSAVSAVTSFQIAKANQAALAIKDDESDTVTALTKQYGGAGFMLTPSGGSGDGAYSWTSSNTDTATILEGVVTILGAGTTTITLNKAGDDNYNAATATTLALTVAPKKVDAAAIAGVTAPGSRATPVTAITADEQYTGTVSWNGNPSKFADNTVYAATITLTPTSNYTLTGVAKDFFTVAGADSVIYTAGSNTVTAIFPKTGNLILSISTSGDASHESTSDSFELDLAASANPQTITLTGNISGDNLTSNPIAWTGESKWGFSAGDTATAGTKTITIPAETVGSLEVTATAKDDASKTLTITINVAHSKFTVDWQAYTTNYLTTKDVPFASIDASAAGVNYDHGSTNVAITSRTFRARLFKGGDTVDTAATVNWEIVSQTGEGATWNTNTTTGVGTNYLNIPTNYAGTISVKLSSAANPEYDVTFDIFVDVRPQITTAKRNLTGSKIGDTVDWLEIATKTVGGNSYSLIVRKNALEDTTTFGAADNNDYMQSALRTKINTWYAGLANNNELLRTKAVTHTAMSRLGTTHVKVDDGYSLPLGAAAGTETTDIAFPLSSNEAISFLSAHYFTPSGGTGDSPNDIKENWRALADNGTETWLRSPCYSSNVTSYLHTAGNVAGDNAPNTTKYARPALWVSSDIFD
jgi:hypothetical protein